jgi:hypothetical protein
MNLALSRPIPGFDSSPVDVRYLVSKVSLVQAFLRLLRFTPLSVSFRHCSVLIFILTLLLSEGQGGEAWERTQQSGVLADTRVHWSGGYLDVVFQTS